MRNITRQSSDRPQQQRIIHMQVHKNKSMFLLNAALHGIITLNIWHLSLRHVSMPRVNSFTSHKRFPLLNTQIREQNIS
jgi:hypothetical protein